MIASTTSRPRRVAVALTAAAFVASAFVGGCSTSSGSGSNDPGEASDRFKEELEVLYKGTSTSPATDAPKPTPGKKIWVVSVGQAVDVSEEATGGVEDAAESIGWDVTIFDGQFQPNLMLSGVQQAIAAKADGIILYAIDCAIVKSALEAAKEADIPVVGIESQDCEPSLEVVTGYAESIGGFEGIMQAWGEVGAQWLISQTGTEGTTIELRETDSAAMLLMSDSFQETLASQCPDCKNVPIEFTAADIGPSLQQKVQQALLQNPGATGLFVPYDGLITSGVSAAVLASGRADQIKVISGGSGRDTNLDLIREGRGQNADIVTSTRWEGYASVDWMNRLLNGQMPTPQNAGTGIGIQLIDSEHNLPESGAAVSTVDFEGIYEQSWGVGE
jgi:ribose transport system substrate-binding protein